MAPRSDLTSIGLATRLKWQFFRLLERVSDLRGNTAAGHLELSQPPRPLRSLWVFVSTIGELNAIDPLLRQIIARVPRLKLVLITDHPHYRDSYLARYPDAEICVTLGHGSDAKQLARYFPPRLLVVAEIPCWPSDGPCRFSFAFLLEAKSAGAVTVLVNAWLYHYKSPSRMDAIERSLFQTDFLRAFDAIGAQTQETKLHLLAAGAEESRVSVTGNIKFDAVAQPDWTSAKARSPVLLGALIDSARPVIVAGCVTNLAEQEMVLDAFVSVCGRHPDALLILAPRHPEVGERMQVLRNYLEHRGLTVIFKSTSKVDEPLPASTKCMVLDTMGELRDFYACATVAHVGVDHNVLEPLAFGKPVTVLPNWDTTYPSYPVYRLLMDMYTLLEANCAEDLSTYWLRMLEQPEHYRERLAATLDTLSRLRGAVDKHLLQIDALLPSSRPG